MKKMLCSLMLVFVMLFTMMPTWALSGNIFIISKAEIVGVTDGNEYKTELLPKGTVRAKMKFSNFTGEAQEVVLYITSKDDANNRLMAVNTKTVTVPDSATNVQEYIDIEVKDNTKESVYLYVWDKHQSAYCEVEQWAKLPAFDIIEVRANITGNVYTDSILWKKNNDPMIKIDLLKVYDEEDKINYEDVLYSYSSDGWYLRSGLKVYEGDESIRDFLGYDVDINLFYNSDDCLQVYSYEVDYKSMEELVVTKDIVTASVSNYGVTFEYWADIENDSKVTEVDVSYDAMIYVNNETIGSINGAGKEAFEYLDSGSFCGSVKFLGSKGEDFSKIFITEKLYYQAENIYVEDEYIELDYGSIELSKEARGNDRFFYTIYKNGEKITLSEIEEGDVLSIVAPGNDFDYADYLLIYVCDETISGTVTGAKSGANNKIFYIDGVEYTTVDANALSVGDEGIFYLTDDGRIYDSEAYISGD